MPPIAYPGHDRMSILLTRSFTPSIPRAHARDTVALVSICLAIVLLIMLSGYVAYRLFRIIRRKIGARSRIANRARAPSLLSPNQPPDTAPEMSPSSSSRRGETKYTEAPIISFFQPLRKATTVICRPAPVPLSALHISLPRKLGYHLPRENGRVAIPPASFVSPHTAAWVQVADSVVGRHPNAQPLQNRIATQAEIDIISGKVYIPWACGDVRRPKPLPPKVHVPANVPTPTPAPITQSNLLKEISNLPKLSFENASWKFPTKLKAARRTRGKENIPVALLPGRR